MTYVWLLFVLSKQTNKKKLTVGCGYIYTICCDCDIELVRKSNITLFYMRVQQQVATLYTVLCDDS